MELLRPTTTKFSLGEFISVFRPEKNYKKNMNMSYNQDHVQEEIRVFNDQSYTGLHIFNFCVSEKLYLTKKSRSPTAQNFVGKILTITILSQILYQFDLDSAHIANLFRFFCFRFYVSFP